MQLLDLIAHFGALLELPSLAAHRLQGPLAKIAFDRRGDWTGWEVERLLLHFGVRIYGRGFDTQHLYFHVHARQANWAEYVLNRYLVSLTTAHNPANANARTLGPIPSWRRPLTPHSLGAILCELLDQLKGAL